MKAAAVLLAALVAAGCTSSRPPDARPWLVTNSQAIRVMRGDAANLELVVLNESDLGTYAAPVTADVAALEARMPTPDKKLTDYLHLAAESYGQAAVDALVPQETVLAHAYLVQGDGQIKKAIARSDELGHDIYSGT